MLCRILRIGVSRLLTPPDGFSGIIDGRWDYGRPRFPLTTSNQFTCQAAAEMHFSEGMHQDSITAGILRLSTTLNIKRLPVSNPTNQNAAMENPVTSSKIVGISRKETNERLRVQ